MDEYTRLKTKIESYLELPEVELTEEVISVGTLINILESGLERLRKTQFDTKFQDEINKSHTIIEKVGRVFKKKVSVCTRQCNYINASCDGKKSQITFGFKNKENKFGTDYLTICKDIDSDQIYFDRFGGDKEFVEKHYDRINEFFEILEVYSSIYQGGVGGSGTSISQQLSDGFFDIEIVCDTYGRVKSTTTVNKEVDESGVFTREWFQRQTLSELYKENSEEILKRIPVDISSLNYTMQTLVKEASSKQNVPVLVKKK